MPTFDFVATGTADYPAGTGTVLTPADLEPGEFRLLVFCAPRADGVSRGYSARVFVASDPFFFVRDTEKTPGESFWVQEATCGANGTPPARLDLVATASQASVVHIDDLDLTAFRSTVTMPLTAAPGGYDLRLTCGPTGTPEWTVPMSVVDQVEPTAPTDPPAAATPRPLPATPAFTG